MNVFAVARRGFRKLFVCCAIAVLCLGHVFIGTAGAADPPAIKGLGQALVVQVLNEGNLFSHQGVAAVGISADNNGRAELLVLTERAGVPGIPNQLQGVPVRVMVTGKIVAFFPGKGNGNDKGGPPGTGGGSKIDPTGYFDRPVPIGVSSGTDTHAYCFAGTLGCRLRHVDGTGNVTYFSLSNNHVFAEENAGQTTDLILQPGTYDSGCIVDSSNAVGKLAAFVPINFNGANNYVDAAIASVFTDSDQKNEVGFETPGNGYGAPSSTTVAATLNLAVEKYGRTTSDTKGVVSGVNMTVNVGYDVGVAVFANQIVIVGTGKGKTAKFSDAGDSGSLIVDQTGAHHPVGLLFAGSSGGGPVAVTIANPIQTVLNELGTKIGGAGYTLQVDDGSLE